MKDRNRHIIGVGLLLLLGLSAYARALGNGFVYDDNFQILRNPFLHSENAWVRLFTSDVWAYTRPGERGVSNYYRPLQMLTYRWTADVAGMNPGSFHAVNLLFHLLATAACYGVLWQLTRRQAWALAGSALFVLHPIHTEAVIWISALTEIGCALFYFLSFWLFLLADVGARGPDRPEGSGLPLTARRLVFWGCSCVCFLLALLWKEMALTLPLLIAAYAVFHFPSEQGSFPARARAAAFASLPYWAVTGFYLAIRFKVLGFFSRVQQPWQLTPSQYALSVTALIGKYWLKLILPVKLNAFHVFHPAESAFDPRALISAALFLVAAGGILRAARRAPLPSFAAVWIFVTLAPVLNLRAVGMNVFTERYLYIPSLGFCLLAVWAGNKALTALPASRRSAAGLTGVTVVCTFYLAQTVGRIPDWRDDFTLYSKTVEASPDSSLMHNSLAQMLRDVKGDFEGAEQQYLQGLAVAAEQRPPELRQVANACVGLASIYTARQQYGKALDILARAQAVDGNLPEIGVAQAVVLMHSGRLFEAQRILLDLVKTHPNDEVILNNLGAAAMAYKQNELAAAYFQRALQIYPEYPDARNNLGRVYAEMGRYGDALPQLERAVALAPSNPIFITNLGVVLGRMGRLKEARAEFDRALEISPGFGPARTNLASLDQAELQRKK